MEVGEREKWLVWKKNPEREGNVFFVDCEPKMGRLGALVLYFSPFGAPLFQVHHKPKSFQHSASSFLSNPFSSFFSLLFFRLSLFLLTPFLFLPP